MPVRPISGSDYSPQVMSGIVSTRYWWDDPDTLPENVLATVTTPSANTLLVRGPWTSFLNQAQTFGVCILRITGANVHNAAPGGFQAAPAYADVWYDGVQYKMLIGSLIEPVPYVVLDVLNNSGGSFAAVAASPTYANARGNTYADWVGIRYQDIRR